MARANNVGLLGTGVNPGFVMDKLPLTITSVCQDVKSVDIIRIQNASTRREPLQRKVGAGMTVDEFRDAVAAGKIKHMGLRESLMMVGNGLGVEFDSVSDESDRADHRRPHRHHPIPHRRSRPGGRRAPDHPRHRPRSTSTSSCACTSAPRPSPPTACIVHGIPDVEMVIKDGVHGDRATAAMVVNSIPRIVDARHGVLTMDDVAVSYR